MAVIPVGLDPLHAARFLALSKDLLALADFEGRFVAVNDAWETALGWSREELLSEPLLAFVHPDDVERTQREAAAMDERGSSRFTNRCRTKAGGWRWLEWVSELRPDEGVIYATARDITERREAEEALRVSERRQRLMLDNLPDSLLLEVDRDLVCRFIGGGALAKAGLSPDACCGRSLTEIYASYGDRAAELVGYNARALEGHRSEVMLHSEVSGENYELKILPLPGEDDQVVGTMIIATNVTEKLAGRQDVERLARVLAATGEAIISSSLSGHIVTVNRRACELFGYTEAEMIGMDTALLVAPEHRHCREAARQAVLNGGAWRGEHEHVTHDGRGFPGSVTLSPVFNEHGALVGRTVLITDSSERREAERRLEEANRRFEQTIANAPIGMALVAIDGSWLEVNQAMCSLVGYERDELLTKTFQDITHPDDLDADLSHVDELLSGARPSYEMEKRYICRDGTLVWALLTVSLVRDGEGRPLHFISQVLDISDRKSAEDRLRVEADLDPLTGAVNRRRFGEVLTAAIVSARRHGDTSALLFIDLDGFKAVNDTHGHQVGDQVLRGVAGALGGRLRATDTFGRQGGDEFVVLLDRVDEEQASHVADQLLSAIRLLEVPGADDVVRIDASIGLAMLNGVGLPSAEQALGASDAAMYVVKTRHRAG